MKFVPSFIALVAVFTGTSSFAKSLDEALSDQKQIEITPVSVAGKAIAAENALRVCDALGYFRLVSYNTEPCSDGEQLHAYTGRNFSKSVVLEPLSGEGSKCNLRFEGFSSRLASVTCAR